MSNTINQIIREELEGMLSEEDPCWDNYTMVGTKMQDGEEVPNCVPEDEAENYEEGKSLSEVTTTLNVPGYNTPFAFAPADDEEEEELEERLAKLNRRVGYTNVNELMSQEALQDFVEYFSPYMVQNQTVAEKIKNNFLRPVNELEARTGTGGRRSMDQGKGKVFKVGNPNSRYGGDSLAVDARVMPNGDVEVLRILGFSTGKPPKGNIDKNFIARQIKQGEAEELNVPFMAEP